MWGPQPRITYTQRMALRLGRRGLILATLGVVWVLYGLLIATSPMQERFSRPGPSPLDWMDSNWWGLLWIAAGGTSAVVGLRRRRAPDAAGFGAIIAPALMWTIFFSYSSLVYFATGGVFGEPRTWASALIWAAVSFVVRVCAGWDDPTDPLLPSGEERTPEAP
jgi:hypothetical protein